MQKRAQFYLIAALVIIGIITSLTTVYNFTKTSKEDIAVYDLSSEINFEGSQVLASGYFNGLTDEEIIQEITQLINFYAQTNPDHDFYGIYGNATTLTILIFRTKDSGSIGLDLGGGSPIQVEPIGTTYGEAIYIERENVEGNTVVLEIGEEEFAFEINPDQNLYVIVSRERGEDLFVANPGGTAGPHFSP